MVGQRPSEAAPVLKETPGRAPGFIRQYFDITPRSSLEEIARKAGRHTVFLVRSTTAT